MSKHFLAIIEVDDEHNFNDLRAHVRDFLAAVPDWVEGFRLTESTTYTVVRADRPAEPLTRPIIIIPPTTPQFHE